MVFEYLENKEVEIFRNMQLGKSQYTTALYRRKNILSYFPLRIRTRDTTSKRLKNNINKML